MGLSKNSVSIFLHKSFALLVCSLIFLFPLRSEIDDDPNFSSRVFRVDFSQFSPAFAVFEDDFLFEQSFSKKSQSDTKEKEKNKIIDQAFLSTDFDGEIKIKNIPKSTESEFHIKKIQKKIKFLSAGELSFGPLASTVKEANVKSENPGRAKIQVKNNPFKKSVSKNFQNSTTINENHRDYRIHGGLSLKEGLAFMGTMEVQWVVGEHILGFGSINIEKATYEIKVNKLIGDIVISIYDNKKNLIGEGLFHMGRVPKNSYRISKNISVFPVNWDYAGQVIDGGSLISPKKKTLSGVNISLYGFDEQTKTNKNGQFSFHNWKKVNSRSIALASKPGYYDSLFIIDSKQPISIPLLSESYMDAFFSYLEDQGVTSVKKKGTVYGTILGDKDKNGYRVSIGNEKPIYFPSTGFANPQATTTSSNGLFSFMGLENGDYQLFIEKNGKIVSQKWVAVEAGKVSTISHNPQKAKQMEFYNAISSIFPFERAILNFFDNDEDFKIREQKSVNLSVMNKHDVPRVSDLRFPKISSKTSPGKQNFISHHGSLKEIPPFFYEKLHKLAEEQNMKLNQGLIFGFIDSPEKYQVAILEKAAKKIVYFNEKAEVIDPNKEIAFGFIMSDFLKGLNSLVIQTDEIVLATDLVFSDHKTISVIKMEIFSLDS